MSKRQYIGARYVPKFFDWNGSAEWRTGVAYEALTIVTFNNASYTSKVPVPPTVGNPANNPQYWALTGNYNAQVVQYRQETETANNILQGNINSEASTRAAADSNLQSQINQIVAPSGEAPSVAEVQNARIGVDGVTYDTLGTAIRSQVGELKGDLVELSKSVDASAERLDTALATKADAIISSASGAIASFPDGAESTAKKLVVGIEPVQDLHGYDNPWPAGGGKNKFNIDALVDTADITISNGNIIVKGTAKNSRKKLSEIASLIVGETYILTATSTGINNFIYLFGANESWYFGKERTITQQDLDSTVFFYGIADASVSVTISDMMIRLSSVSDLAFAPYSNICPITGWDGVKVTVSPTTDEADGQTYSITFPSEAGTVYGGTLDVTNGVLTVDRAQIASYNGETLPGKWISDRDVYAAGASPTTGAQVVYELATPITYHLTPQEITTLLGQNNIWADTGDTFVTYKADTKLYIDKKFVELQALILEN